VFRISLQHVAKDSRPSIVSPQILSAIATVITTFIFSVSYKLSILAPSGLSHVLGLLTVALEGAVHCRTPSVLN